MASGPSLGFGLMAFGQRSVHPFAVDTLAHLRDHDRRRRLISKGGEPDAHHRGALPPADRRAARGAALMGLGGALLATPPNPTTTCTTSNTTNPVTTCRSPGWSRGRPAPRLARRATHPGCPENSARLRLLVAQNQTQVGVELGRNNPPGIVNWCNQRQLARPRSQSLKPACGEVKAFRRDR